MDITAHSGRTNIMVGCHQTNQKIDTGKTLTRWPVFVDHFNNIAWQDNWGFSPTTSEEIAIATENVQNIMGMIARKDGRIIGFTMMHFTENKVGRAFFSGVLPEYRQRGLSVVLTSKLSSIAIQQDISNFSISWMLEDNKMIVRTMQKLTRHGESQLRRYRIFAIQKII
ncbi:GNAT family N-acetyltransferase [Erwinia pyrifoliae]|uniref:GNAT family N-acetyltransferase n=1 Tax=Erwinia pyrifoliae TaxID=79967 RepID=UPI0021C21660|nr:GNAT family N-acetyltransferase [Erwinia pyrifoliae]UXK12936.1 GNAT family N-acetyltransferase [Erwinia pyrifoliae]